MNRKLLRWPLAFLCAPALVAASGGTLNFANRVPAAGINAPVYDTDGTTLLAGAAYLAQLYAGPTAEQLAAAGTPVAFRTGILAGYFNGGSVELTNVGPTATAYAQVRVWAAASGASYEAAVAAGGKAGVSGIITVVTGGGEPPVVPGDLVGLQSFWLGQGPLFTKQPVNLTVFVGEGVRFEAAVSSTTPVSLQWQFNGVDISGATGPTLELAGVRLDQAGVYRLVASNATATTMSVVATLTVRPIPEGATVAFQNRLPAAGIDAPAFDADGVTRLAGAAFLAQLYAGASPDTVAPVGSPVPFGTGADAGYWLAGDEFWRAVPGLAGGDKAYVQVRVWESAKGETYEAAKAAGGKTGESEVLELATGGGGTPPAMPVALTGLQSFRVGRPPVITEQPAEGHVRPGQSFAFVVQVSSEAPVTYQWFFNGSEIAGATQARLEFPSVALTNAGSYYVAVSNFSGLVASAAAELYLSGGTILFVGYNVAAGIDAPVYDLDGTTKLAEARYWAQLYAGPTAEELAPAGQPAPFRTGLLAGYWVGGAVELPNVAAGETAFVQVKAWDSASGATYEAAWAANGKTGASALLQVKTGGWGEPPAFPADMVGLQSFHLEQGPVFIQQPISLAVFVGQTAVFAAQVQSVTPVSYQWQFNGADLAGATGSTLELPNVRMEQAGVYQLVARNATRATTSAAATLAVYPVPVGASLVFANRVPQAGLDAPVFDTDGVTRLAGSGFVAQLYAGPSRDALEPVGKPAAFGTGDEAGYWQMEDELWRIIPGLAGGDTAYVQVKVWEWAKGETFDAAKAAGGKVGESEILELATGGGGAPPAAPVVLTGLESFRVGRLPLITGQPVGGAVPVGQNFTFDARVSSDAPVTYQWLFNGAELAGATQAELQLTNVQPPQAGAYQVVVSNFVGSVTSAACQLQVSTLTAGGTFWFNNRVTSPLIDAPVYDVNNVTRLAGTNYLAQLWVGPSTNEMAAVGQPRPFSTGALAGYIVAGTNAMVEAPNVAPGWPAFVQMRAWAADAGATYEEAVAAGGACGASAIISVIAGGIGEPPSRPACLVGLRSFRLHQAPVIVTQTGDIIAYEGQPLYLEVQVVGSSPLTYTWQQQMTNGTWRTISGATSYRLWLGTATKEMEGGYRVIVRDPDGTTTGDPMYVYVSRFIFLGREGWEALRLELTGEGGPVYLVEISTNLVNWSGLGLITNETTTLEFSDPTAAGFWARFYRAKSAQSGAVVSKAAAGFVVLDFPYGFSMRANPLLTGNDTVAGLLGNLFPDGTMLYKFNGTLFEVNTYIVGGRETLWDGPITTLKPGEGFILRNHLVDTFYLAIVGQVPEGRLVNQIPVGWSIQASQVPQAGRADTVLGVPLVHGDNIDLYVSEIYDYEPHVTDGAGNWPIGGPPEVWLGESFWIYTTTAREWVREFSTKP